jgi:hypothetical protein
VDTFFGFFIIVARKIADILDKALLLTDIELMITTVRIGNVSFAFCLTPSSAKIPLFRA